MIVTRSQARASALVPVEHMRNVLPHIIQFMLPRELLSLMLSCRELMGDLSLENVLLVTLINGKKDQKTTIKHIVDLHSAGTIFPVGPLRLLRLVCGYVCETCRVDRVKHVRVDVGLFICFECLKENTRDVHLRSSKCDREDPVEWDEVIRLQRYRVASHHTKVVTMNRGFSRIDTYYLWNGPALTIRSTGERIGPIVSYDDASRFTSMNGPDEVDLHLNLVLGAPPMVKYEPLVSLSRSYRRFSHALRLEKEAKLNAKKLGIRAEKMLRAKIVVDALIARQDLKRSIRSVLSRCREKVGYLDDRDVPVRTPCLEFPNVAIDVAMRQYILAPSKARTKALLSVIVDELNAVG